jgi:protein-L-isoaspartate(D-aspartate) O-methyltransferase
MNADFERQRIKMVDSQVRTTDVTSAPILAAMLEVPREAFVPAKLTSLAYIDEDLQIAEPAGRNGPRYLMEPSPFARLVQLAGVLPGDFVLDVGAGSGYSSAVLSRLASSVIALESDPALADLAASTLARLGYDNVVVVKGELSAGFPSEAPYDVIFVGGCIEQLPESLKNQLKEGGRLVAVEGGGNAGRAMLYLKSNEIVTGRRAFNAAVKPLPGFERITAFEF